MATQAEALSGQLAVERAHLLRFPVQESREFAAYLRSHGVRPEVAAAVVEDVAASAGGVDAALDIHAVRALEACAVVCKRDYADSRCVHRDCCDSASSMASTLRSWARRPRQQRRLTSLSLSAQPCLW